MLPFAGFEDYRGVVKHVSKKHIISPPDTSKHFFTDADPVGFVSGTLWNSGFGIGTQFGSYLAVQKKMLKKVFERPYRRPVPLRTLL